MIISDLQYLEPMNKDIILLGGAGTTVDVVSTASGDLSNTNANAITRARELLNGGSVAIGIGRGFAVASDPNDATATVGVSGDAQGDISVVYAQSKSIDRGNKAVASGTVVAVGITLPQ
jgi:hypothetical protein